MMVIRKNRNGLPFPVSSILRVLSSVADFACVFALNSVLNENATHENDEHMQRFALLVILLVYLNQFNLTSHALHNAHAKLPHAKPIQTNQFI